MVVTVEQLAVFMDCPNLPRVLRTPLPYNSADSDKPALMLELMAPAGDAPVLADAWGNLRAALQNGALATKPFVLQTGVSGVGKTKAAYDIGLRLAFVVVSHIMEQDALTPPWLAFREFAAAVCNSAARDADHLPPLAERNTLKAALIVLLGAHLDWVVAVSEAAVSEVHADAFAAAARAQLAADDAAPVAAADGAIDDARKLSVLHEVVLRAQRNGLAYHHVAVNFKRAMLDLLAVPAAIADDGTLQVTVAAAAAYLDGIVARAHAAWSTANGSAPRIVWAHDEAHALLSGWGLPDDLFAGTHVERGAPLYQYSNLLFGLLAAIRATLSTVRAGHLLLGAAGSGSGLAYEVTAPYSPAQGRATATQQAVHLTATDIRAWFARYLTPAAMDGITDDDCAPLAGRPLFASRFWAGLMECSNAAGVTPADIVRTALAVTVSMERKEVKAHLEVLWPRSNTTYAYNPSSLLRNLFCNHVMSAGSRTALGSDTRDEAERRLLSGGILNVRDGDVDIRLGDEAVTAAALRELGVERIQTHDDGVRAILAERRSAQPEILLAWALLRMCLLAAAAPGKERREWVPLLKLLEPYLACTATTADRSGTTLHPALLPFGDDEWEVCLTEGRRGDSVEWASRSPLSLLAAHPTALVHHLREGPGLMFLARRRDTPTITVPVLLQLHTSGTGSLTGALSALDLGRVHPDKDGRETAEHADMRATLAAAGHEQWALPIRCVVGTQAYTSQLLRDVAWLNRTVLRPSPLMLMQLTAGNLGVDIAPAGAAPAIHISCPRVGWPACALPSPVRYWAGAPPPALAASADLRAASLRVRFSSASATKDELVAAVGAVASELGGDVAYRRHWLRRAVTATFTHAAPAIEAVLRCRNGRLTAGGAAVTAAFV